MMIPEDHETTADSLLSISAKIDETVYHGGHNLTELEKTKLREAQELIEDIAENTSEYGEYR